MSPCFPPGPITLICMNTVFIIAEVHLKTPPRGSTQPVWWRPSLTCIPKGSSTEISNPRTSSWITEAMPSWWVDRATKSRRHLHTCSIRIWLKTQRTCWKGCPFNGSHWLFCLFTGGLWLCQEDWVWEEDMDFLRDPGVRGTWDHPEQGAWHLRWLLVVGDPHVRTPDWKVREEVCGYGCRRFYCISNRISDWDQKECLHCLPYLWPPICF